MEGKEFSYRIGHTVMNYDIQTGAYGSHCGITDLYPECEKRLKELLDSGEDFRTGWGSKKELLSAVLLRIDNTLRISVHAWVDDLWDSDDLIYDAYWEATGLEDQLPDAVIEEIRDYAYEVGCDDEASSMWEGDCPDYDTIMEIVSKLADQSEEECHKWFKALVRIVSEVINVKGE